MGCVNGVVCLWDYKSGNIILWNPCIRKYYALPGCCSTESLLVRVFGFGYDALTNDYKVVRRVSYVHNELGNESSDECSFSVFSLREKCWKTIDYVPDWNTWCRPRTVGGVIHRVTSLDDRKMKIVSFNLSSEKCSEFTCPEEVTAALLTSQIELSVFRDSLALIYTPYESKSIIWVLREDGGVKSWIKLFLLDLVKSICKQFIVGFRRNGLVVMVGQPGGVVEPIVTSPMIVNLELLGQEYHWHVESYTESLVLLQEGDDVTLLVQGDGGHKKRGGKEAPVTIIID